MKIILGGFNKKQERAFRKALAAEFNINSERVYVNKKTGEVMIFDHALDQAWWSDSFTKNLDFETIEKQWMHIGDL